MEPESRKLSTWKENLQHYFSEYCGKTCIHGIQYLGERGRLVIEKVTWSIVLIIIWSACIFFVVRTYNKWVTSPVIVAFSTSVISISEIPFPAVTITPEANADSKVFNYTDVLIKKALNHTTTPIEDDYFDTFSTVCADATSSITPFLNNHMELKYNLTLDALFNLYQAFPEVFANGSFAMWKGKIDKNRSLLAETINSQGLSLTFNMLDYTQVFNNVNSLFYDELAPGKEQSKWSLDRGYSSKSDVDVFPKRCFTSGIAGGFVFIAFSDRDDSKYSCNIPFSGYEVMLHHPCELPNLNKQLRLPLDQIVSVAVRPRMISISDSLKSYKPEDRKCYLTDEKKLYFFKSYTQQNCKTECILNYTRDLCKCLPLYMLGYDDLPICGPGNIQCALNAEEEFIIYGHNRNCNCMPSCTSLEYDVEISQTKFSMFQFPGLQEYGDVSNISISVLIVYYKEGQFLPAERNELYGYVDFFSNVGGLLGLLTGFSLTSIIEKLYFLSLRLACNIKMYGKKYWSGASELINKDE